MPKQTISVEVEVRDEREAGQVQQALQHIVNLNGATGALNLFDELQRNPIARNLVNTIVKKFRREPR